MYKKKLKEYKVSYSPHTYCKVKAFTANGARRQAWDAIKGKLTYTYGWTKSEFLKKAKVIEL